MGEVRSMSYENSGFIISEEKEKNMLLEFAEQFGYKIEKPEEASLEELRDLGMLILSDTQKNNISARQIPIIPDEQISIEEYMGYNVPMIHLVSSEPIMQNPVEIKKAPLNKGSRTRIKVSNKIGYKSKKC